MNLKRKLITIAVAVVALVALPATYALGHSTASDKPAKPANMPACVTEDSGPNPCYWDASTRGNGKGTSFILFNDQVYRLAGTID